MTQEQDVSKALGVSKAPDITPRARLRFATGLFSVLVLLLASASAAYIYLPSNLAAKDVFEAMKIGIFPLITLILTFYFTHR